MPSLSHRPTYTKFQLSAWLTLIRPQSSAMTLEHLADAVKGDPLATLRRIHLLQLAAVPFANLQLHYSTHHSISLEPDIVFNNVVERRMGGYCMENNLLYATVLRSLGYDLYSAGARVSREVDEEPGDPGDYGGWSHMVNIVTIDNQRYLVDVGFGAFCPVCPIKLQAGEIVQNIADSQTRLLHRPIAPYTDSNQKMWVFEARKNPESRWQAQYCFPELEFVPEDFAIMNYFTSQHPTSSFTKKVIMSKILVEYRTMEAVGRLTLSGNVVKQRLHGTSATLATCRTENERVRVLDAHFGVKLHPGEIIGIEGMSSALGKGELRDSTGKLEQVAQESLSEDRWHG